MSGFSADLLRLGLAAEGKITLKHSVRRFWTQSLLARLPFLLVSGSVLAQDAQGPVFRGITPQTVNVFSAAANVFVDVQMQHDLSGVRGLLVTLTSLSGNQSASSPFACFREPRRILWRIFLDLSPTVQETSRPSRS